MTNIFRSDADLTELWEKEQLRGTTVSVKAGPRVPTLAS